MCEIHQLRAAGIGHVGYVDAAIRSTSEVPDQKSIDVAKQQIAGFRLCARARDIFENPANLKATEIGGQRQTGMGAIAILSAMGSELGDCGSNARVLPDNRVVNGLPSFLCHTTVVSRWLVIPIAARSSAAARELSWLPQ